MNTYPIHSLQHAEWPPLMHEMADTPKQLFIRGDLPNPALYRYLCIVGSRSCSPHGKETCERLIRGLAGHAICIVSGLALGIDGIAHRAALDAGLPTLAIPGSGLADEDLYPQSNVSLAQDILNAGGALLSEFASGKSPGVWSFPRRNRIMAGISMATLIVEGGAKSGTLITARLAMEYNRDVMVVPGPIFAPHCEGSNALLREGAIPITSSADILEALGIRNELQPTLDFDMSALSDNEKKLVGILVAPHTIDDLARASNLPAHVVSMLVSGLELKGIITHRMGMIERCV